MFVSDELMGKLLKSTNITTEDVEEDEMRLMKDQLEL